MPRYNIKHPETKMWRCYSSVVDDWISDWMTEGDYKQWLIDEEIGRIKLDLERNGIRESNWYSVEEIEYIRQLNLQKCNDCKERGECDCDYCEFNLTFEIYKEQGDDYLHIFD